MCRVAAVAFVGLMLGGSAWAYDIQYNVPPGTTLVRETKESGEFTGVGDIPGFNEFEGKIRASSKLEYAVTDIEGSYGVVKVSGARKSEADINENPLEPQTDDMGPATLKVTEVGEVIEAELPAFKPSAESMQQFAWWNYIAKQLNLVDGLPEYSVEEDEAWESSAKIKSPAGGELTVKTTSRVIGTSWDGGKCALVYSESTLPLKLEFKTDEGNYTVDGQVDVLTLTRFNTDKGFPTSKKAYQTAKLILKSKAGSGGGQDYSIKLVATTRVDSKMSEKKAEEQK